MVDVFRGLNLFFSAILAGGMTLELLVLIPAMTGLPGEQLYTVYRFVAKRSAFHYALPCGIASGLAAIVVLIVDHDFGHAATTLRVLGLVVLVCGALATGSLYMHDLYIEIKKLPTLADSEAPTLLSRWRRAQLVRTILYVSSLVLFIAADVVY